MRKRTAFALVVTAWLPSCAPTSVQETYQLDAPLRRPSRILVYGFAADASEVELDRGIGARLQQMASGTSQTEQQLEVGREASRTIAEELVRHLAEMGMPAQRAFGAPAQWDNALVVEGQLVSIDEGNRTQRLVIGLGAGASHVQTNVQVYATSATGLQPVQSFSTDVASGIKPGAAETMGVGAATGAIAAAAAAGGAAGLGSETLSAGVDAEAKRTAKAIAERMQTYFVEQGWLPAPQ